MDTTENKNDSEDVKSFIEQLPYAELLDESTMVLENGDIVLPEELDFYDDLSEEYVHDWYAEEEEQKVESLTNTVVKVEPSEWTEFAVNMP